MRKYYTALGILAISAGAFFLWQFGPQDETEKNSLKPSEIVDYDSLNNSRPITYPPKERKNPRPTIPPKMQDSLTEEERREAAIKFAELFKAEPRGSASRKSEHASALEQPKLDDIERLKSYYGEDLGLKIRQDELGRLEGLVASIKLDGVIPGDAASLNTSVENFVSEYPGLFGADHSNTTIDSASFCPGNVCTTKIQKSFAGLPAWDHELAITTVDGEIISAQGEFYTPRISSFDDPNMGLPEMTESISQSFSVQPSQIGIQEPAEFGIAREGSVDFIAYKLPLVLISGHPYQLVINASTGKLASRESLIQHTSVTASGTDLEGNTVTFGARQNGSFYELVDTRFPEGFKTEVFDFNGLAYASNDSTETTILSNYLSGTEPSYVTSSQIDSAWDPAAVSAISNAKLVSDYFLTNHSYKTINSSGDDIKIGVSGKGENASFRGNGQVLEFGVGEGNIAEKGLSLAIADDVMAHEITHGVIDATSKLQYRNQSGALNEAFSDLFGAMVDSDDWLIGDKLRSPSGKALRSMSNPAAGLSEQPSHMSDYIPLPDSFDYDYGGVHHYSGIINRALYLLSDGLTAENLGTSIGRTKTANLTFLTMTTLTQRASFDDAVEQMLAIAGASYGQDSVEKQAVSDAFSAVGLPKTQSSAVSGEATTSSETESAMVYLNPYYSQASTADEDNLYRVYAQIINDADPQYVEEKHVGPLNNNWAGSTRPTIVRGEDGSFFVLYQGTSGSTFLYTDSTALTEELDLGIQIAHVALSQDRKKIVLTETDKNVIYVYDFETEKLSIIDILLPSFAEGETGFAPYYVDTLRFDPTSRFVVFDFAICDLSSGESCDQSTYWSIGVLNVTDESLEFPFPSQSARYDIGFPAFSNKSDRYIVMDIRDNEADTESKIQSFIGILDREDNTITTIANTDGTTAAEGHWGTPSFSTNDSYVTLSFANDSGTAIVAAFLDNYEITSAEEQYRLINPNFGDAPLTIPAVAVNKVPSLSLTESTISLGDIVKGSSASSDLCVENAGEFPIELGKFSTTNTSLTWGSAYSYLQEKTKLCSPISFQSSNSGIGEFSIVASVFHDGANSPTPVTITGYVDLDTDGDGSLNYKDEDDDNDNVLDADDAFPLDSTESVDTDSDGIGNNADTDDDGDGTEDSSDAFPLDATETLDTDSDGIGNNADTDDDGDGTEDNSDAFPLDATETLDTDSDGVGNNADTDDDGDGLSDSEESIAGTNSLSADTDSDGMNDLFEVNNNLDPNLDDASLDTDGDGLDNLGEYQANSDPNKDDVPPALTPPADVQVTSTGVLTEASVGVADAEDVKDGEVTASASNSGPFPIGTTSVIWTASDLAGNESTATQTVTVIPFVETLSVGRVAEGSSFELKVVMNGEASSYPIDIPVSFSGTATLNNDFTASSSTISISSGTEGSISLNIASDSEAEGSETIIATLSSPSAGAGLGASSIATINIVEASVPPVLKLAIEQNGNPGKFVATDAGQVNVTLTIADPNGTHSVDWSSSDGSLVQTGSSQMVFAFDPTWVAPGNYKVIASVTDSEISDATYNISTVVNITTTNAKVDSDGDGISDEQDTYSESNLITTDATKTSAPASTDTGLTIVAGDAATSSGTEGVQINENIVADAGEDGLGTPSNGNDVEYGYPSGVFDFAVQDLPVPGESVNIVLPIAGGIPAYAVYRKFESTKGWFNFEIDDDNFVSSAKGTSSSCPAAGNDAYSKGLDEGDFCLQLTIKDGGVNDADGTINGVVDDPGGLAVDDNPPTVMAPVDASVEAESGSGVASTNEFVSTFLSGATASDGADGDLTASVTTSESGDFIALGDNIVTFSATDTAGNVGSDTATLSVVDTTPPNITPPSAATVSTTSGTGIPKASSSLSTFFNGASATDTVDSSPTITDDAPARIPVGTTTVTFTATDASGNSASDTSTITVRLQSSSGGSGGSSSGGSSSGGGGGGCSLSDGEGPIDPSLPILLVLALLGIFRYKLGLE